MRHPRAAPVIVTALLLASCDTGPRVLGSLDNPPRDPGPAATVPPATPPMPPSSPVMPTPPPAVPALPPPPPPSYTFPTGYPPGPYGYQAGQTLLNFLYTTRENYRFAPDDARKMAGVKVILLLQTTEGCCAIVRQLNEINDAFAPRGLFMIQLVTHNRAGRPANAQTLNDWDSETGYTGFSVFGLRMRGLDNVVADTPALVLAHARTMKVQTFTSGAALGGIDEIRAAVQAALASAP